MSKTVDMKDVVIQKLSQQIGQYAGLVAELEVKIMYFQQELERITKEQESKNVPVEAEIIEE